MIGVDGAAEGDDDLTGAREAGHKLFGHAAEAALVDGSGRGRGIEAFGLDAENLLGILFVAEDDVAALHEGGHHFRGAPSVFPEILAEIQVTTDSQAEAVRSPDSLETYICGALADSGRNAGPVEPVGSVEDLVPVDHPGRDGGEGRAGTVVDDFARPRHGAGLKEVDPETVAAGDAMGNAYAIRA